MALLSVDYLNARRAAKPASGGRNYAVKRNAVDDRAQWNAIDAIEQAALQIDAIFADFHSDMRNRLHVEAIMNGETSDDWSF
jgi:hypothetical protein